MPDLDEALKQLQPAIQEALEQAESELEELTVRRAELEALIARARVALGQERHQVEGRRTLYAAIELVLRETNNRWATVSELARAVNERHLYTKRDGSEVEVRHIYACTNNYRKKFEKDPADRSRVRLKAV
jgi:hypothetical protein